MSSAELEVLAAQLSEPSATDIATAVGIILHTLDAHRGPLLTSDITRQIAEHLQLPGSPDSQVTMSGVSRELLATAPAILWARQHHAARVAIATLLAQGLVVPVELPSGSSTARPAGVLSVPYYLGNSMFNTTGRFSIPVGRYLIPTQLRLTPGLSETGSVPLLTVEKWKTDVNDLLDDRLLRVLDESLSALRRGSYLSAVTLIGAVLEGAWYRVGNELRGCEPRLDRALDNDRTAAVQTEIARLMSSAPRMKAAAADLQSFAGYVRAVRNYGIHPGATDEVAAEDAFTASGAHMLIQRTHSHLVQLLASLRKMAPSPHTTE